MSMWGDLTKSGIEGLASGIGGMAKDLRAAITGKQVLELDDIIKLQTLSQQMELAALEADKAALLGQIEVNKIDAQGTSMFRGGWRPAVGWVCVVALIYQFLINPLLPWVIGSLGYNVVQLPSLDMGSLMTILGGLLGLSGFRTFEKIKGIK